MFDDDTSYLDTCAAKLAEYGFQIVYPYERSFLAIMKTPNLHVLVLIRKKRKMPFYQLFLIELRPTSENYLRLVQEDRIFDFVFDNPELIVQFDPADLTGHDTLITEVTKALEEKFA